MAQTAATVADRGTTGAWIFRVLIIAGAAFMLYSWFAPWWSAKVSGIPGDNHLVLHPWGVDAVAQVRANADESLYSMPWFFTPFMWAYLAVCMLGLAASMFIDRRISLGRINLPLAAVIIGFVGFSYMAAAGIAYGIGELKASWAGSNFVGKSTIKNAMTGTKIKMESELLIGYWFAVASGGVLFLLALIRFVFVRTPKV